MPSALELIDRAEATDEASLSRASVWVKCVCGQIETFEDGSAYGQVAITPSPEPVR